MMNALEARNHLYAYTQKRVDANLMAMEAQIYDYANIGRTMCTYKIDFGTADEETCEKIRDSIIEEAVKAGYLVTPDCESEENLLNIWWE